MRGEILELARKPSLPQAPTGSDAFGRTVAFEDLGERNRALVDFGMTDVDVYALTPRSPVSYTHLDVYKRQALFWSRVARRRSLTSCRV